MQAAKEIRDAAPRDFKDIPDDRKEQFLRDWLLLIDKSNLQAKDKQAQMCTVLVDYCKHAQIIDPVEILTYLAEIQGISLLICERGRDPTDCATDLPHLLSFLGTSVNEVLTPDNRFIIPLLQSEMIVGEDYQIVDGVVKVSHYGMRKIARRLNTKPANVVYAAMSASMDALMAMANYSVARSQDRSKNLDSFHAIEDLLSKFQDRFEKPAGARGSNLLMNLGKTVLRRMFGTTREGLAFATGIDGTIRDAVGNHDFLSFDSTFRAKLLAKLKSATDQLGPGELISLATQSRIHDEMMAYLHHFIEDWPTHKDRGLTFLNIRPLTHRILASKRKLRGPAAGPDEAREVPLVVPRRAEALRRRVGLGGGRST